MDVVVWLRSLGLGKYEAAFRENEIDETLLPSLTHETLKELGVTAVGHRLKLLDAIATLRSDASGKTPSADTPTTSSAPSAPPEDRAERRQVTVMFSDLVGSTAHSAALRSSRVQRGGNQTVMSATGTATSCDVRVTAALPPAAETVRPRMFSQPPLGRRA